MALLEPEITWDLAVGDQDLLLALGAMWDWKVVDEQARVMELEASHSCC